MDSHTNSIINSRNISSTEREELYDLSPLQQGMLFHYLQTPDTDPYITQNILYLEGKLDVACCMESYQMLLQKHQNLRTIFCIENGSYFQKIAPYKLQEVELYNFTDLNQHQRHEKLLKIMDEDLKQAFNLFKEIPIRLKIIIQSEYSYQLIWTTHHIIIDGWCIGILLSDLLEFYYSLMNHKAVKASCEGDYFQYIQWIKEQDIKNGIHYWEEKLKGYDAISDLPKTVKGLEDKADFRNYQFVIPDVLKQKLNKISREYYISMNHIYESIWGIVLQKILNTNDVVFGKVVSGRNHDVEHIESIIGLFINTIVSRIICHKSDTYVQLALKLQDDYFNSYEHDYIALSDIYQAIGRDHMIKHIFAYENFYEDERWNELQDKTGLSAKIEKYHDITNYDLTIVVNEKQETCWNFEYNASIYGDEIFYKIEKYILNVIRQICENPIIPVAAISLVDEVEKNQLIHDFNKEYDWSYCNQTAIDLLNKTFTKKRSQIALVYGKNAVTYEQLDERSRCFSGYLQNLQLQKESPIAVCMDKSLDFIITVIGIVRSGLVYLPVSKKYPVGRIKYILEDSRSPLLVTDDPQYQKELLNVTDVQLFQNMNFTPYHEYELSTVVSSQNAAYIIYTSGTTGKPKGVILTHQGLVNLNQVCIKQFGVASDDVVALFANISFDASISEIFMALFNGACLDIPEEKIIQNPDLFGKYMVEHRISIVTLPPVYLSLLNPNLKYRLKTLITAGSAANPDIASLWGKKYHYINAYGPTEDSVCSTCWSVEVEALTEGNVAIGKPVNNKKIYILDKDNNLMPLGIVGELCISGAGLARGYLNDFELNEEKFIKNPFDPEQRLYKTGDLAKWNESGDLIFIGRIGDQVKIRGHRVELLEVNHVIMKCSAVELAYTMIADDPMGEKTISSFVVFKDNGNEDILRDYLEQFLPDYMIPGFIIQVESLPLNNNGKVDEMQLATYLNKTSVCEKIPPSNKLEEMLLSVWKEVLNVNEIGINESFISLGGDSIKAMRVVAKLSELGYHLEIKELILKGKIMDLEEKLEPLRVEERPSETGIKNYELTPIQNWFFEKKFQQPNHFNQSVLLFYHQGFQMEKVKDTLLRIYQTYDVFQCRYIVSGETVHPVYTDYVKEIELKIFDLKNHENYFDEMEKICSELSAENKIDQGDLTKNAVFLTHDGDYLFWSIHHLAIDAVSWQIVISDFINIYFAIDISPTINKTASFREWSNYLKRYANSVKIQKEKDYWENIAKKKSAKLKTSCYINANCRELSYEQYQIHIPSHTVRKITGSLFNNNTGIQEILLISVLFALDDYLTDETFITLQLESHGRNIISGFGNLKLYHSVGWFTSKFPVVFRRESENIHSCINAVSKAVSSVPNYGIGYGVLEYHDSCFKKSEAQVSFNYLGDVTNISEGSGIKVINEHRIQDVGSNNKFLEDICLTAFLESGELYISITYNKNQIKEAFVQEFMEKLTNYFEFLPDSIKNDAIYAETQTELSPNFGLSEEELALILGGGI